jgi:2-dehydro-3-deoxygluconokinase
VASNNEVHKVESVHGVEVVDTTGAGDAFNAGYLAARFRNFSPRESARYGHLLAAKIIGVRGAIISIDQMPNLF